MPTLTELAESWVWSWFNTVLGIQGFSLEVGFDEFRPVVRIEVFIDSNAADIELPPIPPALSFVEPSLRRISPYYHPVSDGAEPADTLPGLRPGSSVHARLTLRGNDEPTEYGTISAIARSSTGNAWLITANHVTARNGLLGEIGVGDDGVYSDGIGRVSRYQQFVPLFPPDHQNSVDAVAARLDQDPNVGQLYDPPLSVGEPWDDPHNGARVVVFCGANTKSGTIVNNRHNATVPQDFAPTHPLYRDLFQLRITPPIVRGNSGSLVAAYDFDGRLRPIGILTAKSETEGLAVACRLRPALQQLSEVTGEAMTTVLTIWPPQ